MNQSKRKSPLVLSRSRSRFRFLFLFLVSTLAWLIPACGAETPDEELAAARPAALARDLDGNVVDPDISSSDDDDGSGAATGATADCSGGSTAHLVEPTSLEYPNHGEHTLTNGSFALWVCTDHFPIGSAARAEVQAAADLYNDVAGTPITVTLGAIAHRSIAQLFPSSPGSNYLDVVDNSTLGFPCHAAGDNLPSSWAMNTCRHGSGGVWKSSSASIDHFVISVNANAYTFDTVATSTDYPKFENIAHELGHAFGMNHTPDWPDVNGRELLSTMQGGLPILPPHDRGYLRYFYPGTPGTTLNLVASPQVRVPDASKESGWDNRDFAAVNPTELYLASGAYHDCATGAAPVFQAQWLNQGQVSTACTVKNRFRIGPVGDEASSAKITVKAWEAAQLPAVAQDRIAATVTIDESKLGSLGKDVDYELTFKVDRDGDNAETDESDNVVASAITLRASWLHCSGVGITQVP